MAITWTNETRKLSDLQPWPRNPRQIRQKQAERLIDSVDTFGQVETLAVGPNGEVYNGHQRLQVLMQEHGADFEVDVRVASRPLTEKEREKLTVYLHKGAAGEWDFDTLANEFEVDELLDWGFEAFELGIDELDDTNAGADTEPEIDRAEELRQKWGVETGQLWQLGDHRLICGDCTDESTVKRVMGGELADMVFTSPPYAQQRQYTKESDISDWDSLLCGSFDHSVFSGQCQILVNLGMVHEDGEWLPYWDEWIDWMRGEGWRRFGLYVWDQGAGLPGDWGGRLGPAFELIFHFNKQSIRASKWVESKLAGQIASNRTFRHDDGRLKPFTQNGVAVGDTKIPDSVFRVNRQIGDTFHPAPFSIDFSGSVIRTWPADTVYEPFNGSGTTIIACENLGRKCRAVEISPAYVAVALERWAQHTGRTPELIDG